MSTGRQAPVLARFDATRDRAVAGHDEIHWIDVNVDGDSIHEHWVFEHPAFFYHRLDGGSALRLSIQVLDEFAQTAEVGRVGEHIDVDRWPQLGSWIPLRTNGEALEHADFDADGVGGIKELVEGGGCVAC